MLYTPGICCFQSGSAIVSYQPCHAVHVYGRACSSTRTTMPRACRASPQVAYGTWDTSATPPARATWCSQSSWIVTLFRRFDTFSAKVLLGFNCHCLIVIIELSLWWSSAKIINTTALWPLGKAISYREYAGTILYSTVYRPSHTEEPHKKLTHL